MIAISIMVVTMRVAVTILTITTHAVCNDENMLSKPVGNGYG